MHGDASCGGRGRGERGEGRRERGEEERGRKERPSLAVFPRRVKAAVSAR
jgi:hypothetical protein